MLFSFSLFLIIVLRPGRVVLRFLIVLLASLPARCCLTNVLLFAVCNGRFHYLALYAPYEHYFHQRTTHQHLHAISCNSSVRNANVAFLEITGNEKTITNVTFNIYVDIASWLQAFPTETFFCYLSSHMQPALLWKQDLAKFQCCWKFFDLPNLSTCFCCFLSWCHISFSCMNVSSPFTHSYLCAIHWPPSLTFNFNNNSP